MTGRYRVCFGGRLLVSLLITGIHFFATTQSRNNSIAALQALVLLTLTAPVEWTALPSLQRFKTTFPAVPDHVTSSTFKSHALQSTLPL